MAVISRFEDMEVWQLGRKLVKKIYEITKEPSFVKDFGLSSQIQRAAVSVISNIAEGYERGGKKEFIRFLYIAKASVGEVRCQLYIAFDLNYIAIDEFQKIKGEAEIISSSLSGFIKYLENAK